MKDPKLARLDRIEEETAAMRKEIEADNQPKAIVVVGDTVECDGYMFHVILPGVDCDGDVLVAPTNGTAGTRYSQHQKLTDLRTTSGEEIREVRAFRIEHDNWCCDGVGMPRQGSAWNRGAIKTRCKLAASTLWPSYHGPIWVEDEA